MGISGAWFHDLERNPEKKEEFRQLLLNSTVLRKRLADILQIKIDGIERSENSETNYDTPNWAEKQAHRNGRRSAFMEVISLLTITKE